MISKINKNAGLSDLELLCAVKEAIEPKISELKKILIIPPDFTRMHSGAGKITKMLYDMHHQTCEINIIPALGTHDPLNEQEWNDFFEGIPREHMIVHNWRTDVVKLGEVPAEFVNEVSEGLVNNSIDVEVNKEIIDKSYDLIISIGQVVPHEVVGMANYSKNLFVGCGGYSMINQSHMLGAFCDMERSMGKDHSPVRKVFDYAETNFIKEYPVLYMLTVTTLSNNQVNIHGIFIDQERSAFEEAVSLSQEKNITFLDKAPKKIVVYLDEREFKSAWLGNKAIYRTCMAIADGGELIILAPGVKKFGEDEGIDKLIRKYGYVGREKVLELCQTNDDLKKNLSVAAHLIHGSSNSRFSITYAVEHLTKQEVEGVNFIYSHLETMIEKYNPAKLKDGFNSMDDGEEIFYVSNPALGLWASREKFYKNS